MTIKSLLTPTINLTSKNGNINIIFCKDNLESYLIEKENKMKLYPIPQNIQFKKDSTLLLGTKPQYNLEINCKNGNIEVSNYIGRKINLTTKNGNISLYNTTAKKLKATSQNGNINLQDSTLEEFNITNNSGSTSIQDIVSINGFISMADNDIDLKQLLISNKLTVLTKAGNITGKNIIAKNISTITTTGNIVLKKVNSNYIITDNIYGNIALTLPGYQTNYQSTLQTLDGKITEKEAEKTKSLIKTYTRTLIAKTTEGNINIKYLGQNKD